MSRILRSLIPEPRRSIVRVYPDVGIQQGVSLMVQENIGALVVADEENFWGILSERDVIRGVLYQKLPPETTKVSDVLCADVTILNSSDPIEMAMEAMTRTKRRHILVKEDETIVAIVSIGDILYDLIDDRTEVIEQLKHYIYSN